MSYSVVAQRWCMLWVMVVLLVACKPQVPSQYIQPDDMEDLLVDYHLARALAQRETDRAYQQTLMEDAVFAKHGVTRADFDSALAYYYNRADRFADVCSRVAERLEEQALVLGATESEIGKYAQLNADGDTANVWAERSNKALMPVPPYNRWEFSIEADSTYRSSDSFMLQFVSNYVYQAGNKNAIVYMAVDYADTTITRNLRFSTSGLSQLHFPEQDGKDIRQIRGFFYLDGANEETTVARLLFLSNVGLIRFHNQKNDEENQKDSIPQDSVARPIGADTLGRGDTIRAGHRLLPVDSGTAANRVVARDHQLER